MLYTMMSKDGNKISSCLKKIQPYGRASPELMTRVLEMAPLIFGLSKNEIIAFMLACALGWKGVNGDGGQPPVLPLPCGLCQNISPS